ERPGIENAAIDMAFGGEMDHLADAMLIPKRLDERFVANVAANKNQARVFEEPVEVGEIPGVGELVENDELEFFVAAEEQANEVGTDETRAAGDENSSHFLVFRLPTRQSGSGLGPIASDNFQPVTEGIVNVKPIPTHDLRLIDQLDPLLRKPPAKRRDVVHFIRQMRSGCQTIDPVFDTDMQRAITDLEPDQAVTL